MAGHFMILLLTSLVFLLNDAAHLRGKRFLFYDPSDLSTALGYQNHLVPDMTSLVDEASAVAHSGIPPGSAQSGPYNVPNFPAMGTKTGTATGSGSGSVSFAGTNHWRCDSHLVDMCDTQCLDVDPKDGCAFCIPNCHAALSGGQPSAGSGTASGSGTSAGTYSGQGTQSPIIINQSGGAPQTGNANTSQSGSLIQTPGLLSGTAGQSGALIQTPGSLSGSSGQLGNLAQSKGTLSGTAGQSGSGLGGSLSQLPGGLAGTGSGSSAGTGAISHQNQITTAAPTCPHFPPNCPSIYTKLDKNGCLVCTILQQASVTHKPVVSTTTIPTTVARRTCAPKRCTPPCDKGIVLGADGCPRCLCPSHV